jgi:tetratricopeptide (TPR) repeat protein
MRKGRSQRKARGSLPPMSTRAHVAAGSVGGPQVVVGITAPRSEDSSPEARSESRGDAALESREARGPEAQLTIPSVPTPAAPKLEVLAEPTLELVREAERLELVREKSLEIVRESLELVRESLEGEPEPEPEAVQAQAVHAEVAETESDAETEATDTSADFTVIERDSQHAQLTPPPHRSTLLTPDEMSIPPAGDLSVEPVADRFFSEGELATVHGESDEEEWDEVANKAKRKSLPEVVQRRARFAKYVRWAVGGAAVVCLAALARTTMVPAHSQSASAPVAALAPVAAVEAPATKAATPAVIAPAAAPAVVAEPAKSVEAVATAAATPSEPAKPEAVPAEAPEAPKAEAPKADAPKAEAAPEPAKPAATVATGDKTALQEKNDARRLLERGKLADAIEAGERSVALDPTDGEAWLLLGAAYQEKGKNAEARRCYSSCVKEGKRGPLGECRAMVR